MPVSPGRPPSHLIAPAALAAGMAVAAHSVVRYRLWIVLVYLGLAVALGGWQLLRPRPVRPATAHVAIGVAAALGLAAVLHVKVWAYSYATLTERAQIRWLFAVTAGVGAALFIGIITKRAPRWAPDAALAVAVGGYLVAAVLLIRWDPAPKIDVWVMLQQAADGIPHGRNMYALNWHDSPGVQDAFTYLPFTALLLAPARWLAGDVRWGLVVLTLAGALAIRLLGGRRDRTAVAAAGAAALLLLLPGTSTQVEQAWTEPLLLACLAGWALGVRRGNTVLAVVCLALGLASKQHLVLLLPLLAVWPRFGPRRTAASMALAALFVLPWFIASPADMVHDAVTLLIHFQPLVFADTLYIAAINELHWTPPFALTGALVLGTLVLATLMIRRRRPDLAGVLRWAALVLFVANLVNKQAFYNQYWLVAALVLLSLAVPVEAREPRSTAAVQRVTA